jgi:transposase-like protein
MANQRRSVEKEAYWRGQLERQSASGLSIRRWCHENGVSEPTYYVWRRKLQNRDHERGLPERDRHAPLSEAAVAPGFVAVDVVTSDVMTSASASAGCTAQLEIDVAGGVVIRLRENASAETLERVLGVVCRQGVIPVGGSGSSTREREVRSC